MKETSDLLEGNKYYVNTCTKLSNISLRDFELLTVIRKLKDGRYQVKNEKGKLLKFSKKKLLLDNEIYLWHSCKEK